MGDGLMRGEILFDWLTWSKKKLDATLMSLMFIFDSISAPLFMNMPLPKTAGARAVSHLSGPMDLKRCGA